jgi:hypothetical protein
MQAVSEKEEWFCEAVRAQPNIQRTFEDHSLEVAGLCQYERFIVFKISVELYNLRPACRIDGEVGDICNLVKRAMPLLISELQSAIVVRRIDD